MKATRRWKSHWGTVQYTVLNYDMIYNFVAVLKGRYLLLHRWDKGHHSTPTNETLLDMKIGTLTYYAVMCLLHAACMQISLTVLHIQSMII